MEQYQIVIGESANRDIVNLINAISYDYSTPLTAFKYLKGLYKEINSLAIGAESYSIQSGIFYRQYGFSVRKITYKKMSIIYLIVNQCVYIKAVIPSVAISV